MIEELRTQLPIYYEFLYRATYLVELTSQACKAKEKILGMVRNIETRLDQIPTIPYPLKEPDNDNDYPNPIAMKVLWNDPITDLEYQELLITHKLLY